MMNKNIGSYEFEFNTSIKVEINGNKEGAIFYRLHILFAFFF